jgi:hypothetical protein
MIIFNLRYVLTLCFRTTDKNSKAQKIILFSGTHKIQKANKHQARARRKLNMNFASMN